MRNLVQIENYRAEPVQTPFFTITPYIQKTRIGLDGLPFLYIWRRPVSVLVQDSTGQEVVLPVRDATRLALTVLAGISLGVVISGWLLQQARKTG